MKDGKALGTVALVMGALGIAASATLNKLAMGAGMHPVWLNVWRLGVAVLVMLPFFLRKRGNIRAIHSLPRREKWITLLSGAMLAVHFASWAAALRYADSVIAVSIWSTFSLMTVLGSSWLLHEKTPLPALLGLIIAVIGVGVCAIGAQGTQLLGVLFALIAAISQAVYTLCGRTVRRRLEMIPYTMVVYSLAFACMLGCALFMRIPAEGLNLQGIGASVGLALICTLGGHSMQNYALKYYKAPTVSAAILTEVFTGPILVYFVFGEVPSLVSVLGGVIILIGVGWYMVYERRHGNGAEPTRSALGAHAEKAEHPVV